MTIIAIDFDGIIVTDMYPDIGPEIPGAIEAIRELHEHGYCIIINSCRAREQEKDMKDWIQDRDLPVCCINENCRERVMKYRTDCRKISADLYIDDKAALTFDMEYPMIWDIIASRIYSRFGDCVPLDCEK
jgi:hypothetical protein